MKSLLRILAGIFFTAALCACSGAEVLNAITPASGYSITKDLVFEEDGLTLDVYTPHDVTSAPVVVFFYGGSWQASTTLAKNSYKFVGAALASRGFVAVIPDYRVYPQVSYPVFLKDCADAVRWTYAHASAYGGNSGKMVLMGHSAGAYNAAMLTLLPQQYLQLREGGVVHIRGMIGLAGPYDFLPLQDQALKELFSTAATLQSTQPINHVDGRNPPMLLMAGEDDKIVYVKNTINLYKQIRAANGPVEKVIYPGMGHIKMLTSVADALPGNADVMKRISNFVQRVTE